MPGEKKKFSHVFCLSSQRLCTEAVFQLYWKRLILKVCLIAEAIKTQNLAEHFAQKPAANILWLLKQAWRQKIKILVCSRCEKTTQVVMQPQIRRTVNATVVCNIHSKIPNPVLQPVVILTVIYILQRAEWIVISGSSPTAKNPHSLCYICTFQHVR